jgi:hypothetical protein
MEASLSRQSTILNKDRTVQTYTVDIESQSEEMKQSMLGYLNKSCDDFKVELIVRALGMVWCRVKKWPAKN